MVRIVKDFTKSIYEIYKFSLNKREKTLKVYDFVGGSVGYRKHLISVGLTKQDIRDIENMTDKDLLYWMKHDYQSFFSIWR